MPEASAPPHDAASAIALPPRRKRKSGSEKRQRCRGPILVRLLPEERATIETRAAETGLSLAAYGRACMLGDAGPRARRRPPVDRERLARANADLNRVGNLLNQLARAVNMDRDVPGRDIVEATVELRAALADIRQALGYDREG